MAEQIVNNFSTYIMSTIAASDTVIPVASVSGLPTSGGFRAQIYTELLSVQVVSGSILLVTRGRERTTAIAAVSGTPISFPITKEALDNIMNQELGGGPLSNLASPRETVLYYPSNAPNIIYSNATWIPIGPTAPISDPNLSGWSWYNQDGASITQTNGVVNLTRNAQAGEHYAIYDHPAPTPPYTVTCLFSWRSYVSNFPIVAPITIRDGTTNRFDSWCVIHVSTGITGGTFQVRRMTNATTWSADVFAQQMPQHDFVWYRFRDDGVNHYYSFSLDGLNFKQVWQNSRTVFIANPNRVGFGVNPLQATHKVSLNIYSWEEVLG